MLVPLFREKLRQSNLWGLISELLELNLYPPTEDLMEQIYLGQSQVQTLPHRPPIPLIKAPPVGVPHNEAHL